MTMLLGAWTILHVYVFWRLSTVPSVKRHISRQILFPLGTLLWASLLLPRLIGDRALGPLSRSLESFDMTWLGVIFLLFVGFLIIDILTAFGLLFRRYLGQLRTLGLLAGILLATTAFIQGHRAPVIQDYEIKLADVPAQADGLVVAVISDLHLGENLDGRWLAARVDQLNAMKVDMILALGDIFEGDSQSERGEDIKAILHNLSAPYGIWTVTGNHDAHGSRDAGVRFLESAGIHVLRNEWREIVPGLALGGVDDAGHWGTPNAPSVRVQHLLDAMPKGSATIFLSHRPLMAEEAARAGIGLMLSGHTHGGQIWPFSYIVGLQNRYLAGKYAVDRGKTPAAAGIDSVDNKDDLATEREYAAMPLIVTRGAGTWGPRMRLWCPGEILRITLRSNS